MQRMKLKQWSVIAVLMVFLVGCGSSSDDPVPSNENITGPSGAPSATLTCIPADVAYNGNVVLEWSSTNADECTASGSWSGPKGTEGTEDFGPLTGAVSFVLTCTGNGPDAVQTATVTVGAPPTPDDPTVSLIADPTTVAMNGSTKLTWPNTNADTCTASSSPAHAAWTGDKALTGGEETIADLTADTTFTLTCTKGGGSPVAASATVVVTAEPGQPTVTISAEPAEVAANGSTTLKWSSTNADACTASSTPADIWSGDKALTDGEENITGLTEDSTFTLSCTKGGGSPVAASTTVVVTAEPGQPTVIISAEPAEVAANGSTTLKWSSTNADACTASSTPADIWSGGKDLTGEETIEGLTENSTFTLSCQNNGGTPVEESVAVTIIIPGTGTATLSWTPPTTNTDESPLEDLAGYYIYTRKEPETAWREPVKFEVENNNLEINTYEVKNLEPGTWWFDISAYDESGNESEKTNVPVSKVIE